MAKLSVLPKARVTCAGGTSGTSSGETDTVLRVYGEIVMFVVKYSATPAATLDLEVDTLGAEEIPTYQILKLSNNVTDGIFLPRKSTVDINGTALLYSTSNPVAEKIPVWDKLKFTLVQGNVGDYADVWTYYIPSDN